MLDLLPSLLHSCTLDTAYSQAMASYIIHSYHATFIPCHQSRIPRTLHVHVQSYRKLALKQESYDVKKMSNSSLWEMATENAGIYLPLLAPFAWIYMIRQTQKFVKERWDSLRALRSLSKGLKLLKEANPSRNPEFFSMSPQKF